MSSHRVSGTFCFREGRRCGVSRDLGGADGAGSAGARGWAAGCARARAERVSARAHAVPVFTWGAVPAGRCCPAWGLVRIGAGAAVPPSTKQQWQRCTLFVATSTLSCSTLRVTPCFAASSLQAGCWACCGWGSLCSEQQQDRNCRPAAPSTTLQLMSAYCSHSSSSL